MQVQRKKFLCSYYISAKYTGQFYATHSVKRQNFLKKFYQIGSSFHQKSIGVHRTEKTWQGELLNDSLFLCPVCPCVALCRAGGVVKGKAV